ncbi:retrovirus-related pol polyprotein from transposon TNT 1-94 [Tanacetum coccineum]
MDADSAPNEQVHSSDDEDIRNDHILKVNLKQDWWKPLLDEDIPATPEPAWSIPSSDWPVLMNNWASALASTYAPQPENSLLAQTGDMAIFMDWFYKKQGITELTQKTWKALHLKSSKYNVNKPLPLGGQPGQVTIQADFFFNKDLEKVEESLNVTFDETRPPSKTSPLVDDDLDEEEAIKVTEKKNLENDIEDETLEIDEIVNIKESRNHPLENVIGNLNQRTLRSQDQNQSKFFCFISTIEPKNVNEALTDDSWIVAMQEELNQFIANDVWELVAQGYNQQEGIDYDETYAPVARLELIRILLAYACALDFKLFQMDVKNAFLNGFINEEVYVTQPPGFIDFEKPDHVYKLKKALYGLKQAPKAEMIIDDWSEEWDASNPEFRALFILEDGASVARI